MATIKKKIWPEYFDAVASGKKNWELRLNDFEIHDGDTLLTDFFGRKRRLRKMVYK